MKITRDTIFGNIGYLISLQGVKWLLIGFDWDNKCYIAQNYTDKSFIARIHVNNIIGAKILEDYWKELIPYEEIRFNPEKDIEDGGKRSKTDLFRVSKDSK